jgi:hypothetical protein
MGPPLRSPRFPDALPIFTRGGVREASFFGLAAAIPQDRRGRRCRRALRHDGAPHEPAVGLESRAVECATYTAVSNELYWAAGQGTHRYSAPSYFHFGRADEDGHGAFLDSSFRLACPRFHQYPFTPPQALHETIQCVERKQPLLIAVTPSFRKNFSPVHRGATPAWNHFVLAGERYVRSHCRRAVFAPSVRVYRCPAHDS